MPNHRVATTTLPRFLHTCDTSSSRDSKIRLDIDPLVLLELVRASSFLCTRFANAIADAGHSSATYLDLAIAANVAAIAAKAVDADANVAATAIAAATAAAALQDNIVATALNIAPIIAVAVPISATIRVKVHFDHLFLKNLLVRVLQLHCSSSDDELYPCICFFFI